MTRESDIIKRHFTFTGDPSVTLGVGDDAAVLTPPIGSQLLVSTDTLVANTHFFPEVPTKDLAHKAAAVSLSDIAAMGGKPLWMTVSLTAPAATPEQWFASMAQGLTESAATHDYRIVGGDLNRGATLSLTTTVIGATATPPLRRDGAKIGDDIWISGDLGGAAHAVNTRLLNYPLAEEKAMTQAWQKLHRPTPRLPLGLALNGLATAAMDLSDGLIKTLREIGEASGVSPHIHLENLPAAPSLTALPTAARHHCLLAGGDDYEILFTAPPSQRPAITQIATAAVPLTRIGAIAAGQGIHLHEQGQPLPVPMDGYEHRFTDDR